MNQPQHSSVTLIDWLHARRAAFMELPRHEQIYLGTGAALLVIGVALALFPKGFAVLSPLFLVASHGFVVGFILWAWPVVKARWESNLGIAAKAVLHVFAFLVATVLARFQVSEALGLPAQDFDLTVHFMTLLFYLPAWALILSFLLLLAILVGFPATMVSVALGPKPIENRTLKPFAHLFGAMGLAFYCGQMFQWSAENVSQLRTTVLVIATFADYQPAPAYPGIKEGDRIRLHENGVVSSATLTRDGVKLRVWEREPTPAGQGAQP